jgi:hypothetical protein
MLNRKEISCLISDEFVKIDQTVEENTNLALKLQQMA